MRLSWSMKVLEVLKKVLVIIEEVFVVLLASEEDLGFLYKYLMVN